MSSIIKPDIHLSGFCDIMDINKVDWMGFSNEA